MRPATTGSRSARLLAVLPCAAVLAATPGPALAAPSAVPPLPFAAADATNSLDLTAFPDGRLALAWTHAVSRNGVGFALRRAGSPFAPADVQDLTQVSSQVAGISPPTDTTPYRLFRLEGTSLVRHALTPALLDGGSRRTVGSFGSAAFAPCADGSSTLVTDTPPSAGSRTLKFERSTPAGLGSTSTGGTGLYDDDDFPRLAVTCSGGRTLVAHHRDTDLGAGVAPVLSVHDVTPGGSPVELIRIVPPAGHDYGAVAVSRLPDGRVWVAADRDAANDTYAVDLATQAPGDTLPVTAVTDSIAGGDLRDQAVDGSGRLLTLYDAHPAGSMDDDDPGIPTMLSVEPGSTADVRTPIAAGADDRQRFLIEGHPDGRPRVATVFSDGTTQPDDERVTVAGPAGVPGQAADAPVVVRPPAAPGVFPLQFVGAYLPSGDLVAAWQDGGNPAGRILEGGLDTGAPPSLGTVTAPGAVVAGEPVTLGSAPFDPLGVASSGWSVAGTTLDGPRVTTTFTTAGTQTVTAFAVDRAGNRAETTRTIRVLPADAVAPAPPAAAPAPPPGVTPAAADRRAPRITLLSQSPTRLSRRATVLRMRLRADEATAVDLELVGRIRRGRERGTVIVGTARVARLARNRTVTVRLPVRRSIVRLLEGGRLQVRAIATDASGNRRTRTVTVRRAR